MHQEVKALFCTAMGRFGQLGDIKPRENKACASLGSLSRYTIMLSNVSLVTLPSNFDIIKQSAAPDLGALAVSGVATMDA